MIRSEASTINIPASESDSFQCEDFEYIVAIAQQRIQRMQVEMLKEAQKPLRFETNFDFRLVGDGITGRWYEVFVGAVGGYVEAEDCPLGAMCWHPSLQGSQRDRVSVAVVPRPLAAFVSGRLPMANETIGSVLDFERNPMMIHGRLVNTLWRRIR